jgi:hypothetical protein
MEDMPQEKPTEGHDTPGFWRHTSVSSVDCEEAKLRAVAWDEIQPWCNFVVLQPRRLPPGVSVENLTLRPEAPPGRTSELAGRPDWHDHNRCSLRFEIVGSGRHLRVKQFLYDWAPPAFDHPCLWKSRNEPFEGGKNIGWLGTDYRKARAAAVSIDRTTIELSTYEGTFDDEELRLVCRGLVPVDPDARRRILATPLAELCYQSRHREQTIGVPCGYFAHERRPPTLELAVYRAANVPADLPGREVAPPTAYGFRLNTAFVYGSQESPQEVDYVYEADEPAGRYLRLLVSPSHQAGGVAYPPRLDLQPCATGVLSIRGLDVHHAFLTERYGPHEAVWQANGLNFMLLTKPSTDTDGMWFRGLLEHLVPNDAFSHRE